MTYYTTGATSPYWVARACNEEFVPMCTDRPTDLLGWPVLAATLTSF